MSKHRNLKADLELCNEIRALDGFETDDFKEFVEVERIASEYAANVREGWPHAIERAMRAEERIEELENQVDILSTTLNMYCSPYYDMQEQAEKAVKTMVEEIKEYAKFKS